MAERTRQPAPRHIAVRLTDIELRKMREASARLGIRSIDFATVAIRYALAHEPIVRKLAAQESGEMA
jgi:hypothetical protein